MPAGQQGDDTGIPTNDPRENGTPKVSISHMVFAVTGTIKFFCH